MAECCDHPAPTTVLDLNDHDAVVEYIEWLDERWHEAQTEVERLHKEVETLRGATCGQHGIRCRVINVAYPKGMSVPLDDDGPEEESNS